MKNRNGNIRKGRGGIEDERTYKRLKTEAVEELKARFKKRVSKTHMFWAIQQLNTKCRKTRTESRKIQHSGLGKRISWNGCQTGSGQGSRERAGRRRMVISGSLHQHAGKGGSSSSGPTDSPPRVSCRVKDRTWLRTLPSRGRAEGRRPFHTALLPPASAICNSL